MKNNHGVCKTAYARSLGYTGSARVMVQDGRVISHRQITWEDFCERLHAQKSAAGHRAM